MLNDSPRAREQQYLPAAVMHHFSEPPDLSTWSREKLLETGATLVLHGFLDDQSIRLKCEMAERKHNELDPDQILDFHRSWSPWAQYVLDECWQRGILDAVMARAAARRTELYWQQRRERAEREMIRSAEDRANAALELRYERWITVGIASAVAIAVSLIARAIG
ncbi:MAG: hypothetical protein AAF662_09535 [Pseudomonadota bacterium]